MKKSLLAFALTALAGVAHAQSSVNLYGVVDEGFTYTNNVGGNHRIGLDSGLLQADRFGLLGSEDLGGRL